MMMLLAVGAMGYGGWYMYKKYNPDYKRDLKRDIKMMADKVSNMSEDMM